MHFSLASTKAATKYEKSEEIQTFVCKHYIVLINLIYITVMCNEQEAQLLLLAGQLELRQVAAVDRLTITITLNMTYVNLIARQHIDPRY